MFPKTFFIIISFFLFLQSCNETSNQKGKFFLQKKDSDLVIQADRTLDSLVQAKVLDTLSKLPEVQILQKRIDSISDHKHGVSFIIDTLIENQYKVRAGYDGDLRFENYFNFYVNAETSEIKIEDFLADSVLSLHDYRKLKR
jgi:hypothetical protein